MQTHQRMKRKMIRFTTSTSLEQSPEAISIGISSSSSRATIIDQVPTSVSNVTNPKFLTLNLVNYSPSGSSGNNSNSSALIQSRNAAGTADVVAAVASDSSEQLMELDLLRRKLDETEQAMAKIIANMGAIPKGQETEETDNTEADEKVPEQNGHVCKPVDSTETVESEPEQQVVEKHEELEHDENDETAQHQSEAEEDIPKIEQRHDTGAVPKKRETSEDRSSLKVIPMEKKVAYEPGQHSSRPGTPAQFVTLDPTIIEAEAAESKCILLDAAKVPQSSKVTIPESELALETIDASQKSSEETPFDLNLVVVFESLSNLNQGRSLEVNVLLGSEPTTTVVQPSPAARVASPTREVVLSGMMKLSLVKLDDNEKNAAGDVVLKAKDVKKGDTYDGTFGPNEE
ncbi:AAEL014620-PA [Aedes aegypti]|uniref:AAEL014620-PA n=1 Tax=Aedes aegypti TaxID=7159 RepID=Q16FV7_AEDAE|nr:AAEL014620-PA [Aedes aegypti]